MFDFAWSEILLIGLVALIVIGPKDLPVAAKSLAKVLKKIRGVAGEFQSHVDEMVREADLSEVRDHVRDLRSMDVRGRIMKAIDSDGSMARTLAPPPALNAPPAGPRALDRLPAPGILPPLSQAEVPHVSAPVFSGAADSHEQLYQNAEIEAGVTDAPAELPPAVVRRILCDQAQYHPPAILPPVRVVHGHRRVAPGVVNQALPEGHHDTPDISL